MLLNLASLWFLLASAKIVHCEWDSAACYYHLAPGFTPHITQCNYRYVKLKEKMANKCGFLSVNKVALRPCTCMRMRGPLQTTCDAICRSCLQKLAVDVPEDDLVYLVQRLNRDPKIDGILVQVR